MRTLRFLSLLALTCSTLIGVSLASADSTDKSAKSEAASFWTAKRISEAIAFEMVFENGSKVAKRVPVTKAASKPGGGGGGSSVLGSPWLFAEILLPQAERSSSLLMVLPSTSVLVLLLMMKVQSIQLFSPQATACLNTQMEMETGLGMVSMLKDGYLCQVIFWRRYRY